MATRAAWLKLLPIFGNDRDDLDDLGDELSREELLERIRRDAIRDVDKAFEKAKAKREKVGSSPAETA